jgi:hypothetical protein
MPRSREPFNICEELGKGLLFTSVLAPPYLFVRGGMQAVCAFTPLATCVGAGWWGCYSAIEHARRKEETPALTPVLAMAGANGIVSLPLGVRAAVRSSLVGGAMATAVCGGLKLLLGDPPRAI